MKIKDIGLRERVHNRFILLHSIPLKAPIPQGYTLLPRQTHNHDSIT